MDPQKILGVPITDEESRIAAVLRNHADKFELLSVAAARLRRRSMIPVAVAGVAFGALVATLAGWLACSSLNCDSERALDADVIEVVQGNPRGSAPVDDAAARFALPIDPRALAPNRARVFVALVGASSPSVESRAWLARALEHRDHHVRVSAAVWYREHDPDWRTRAGLRGVIEGLLGGG